MKIVLDTNVLVSGLLNPLNGLSPCTPFVPFVPFVAKIPSHAFLGWAD